MARIWFENKDLKIEESLYPDTLKTKSEKLAAHEDYLNRDFRNIFKID